MDNNRMSGQSPCEQNVKVSGPPVRDWGQGRGPTQSGGGVG